MARAWAELMQRLGYTRYVAQGGDVGATVTDDAWAARRPRGSLGIHINLLVGGARWRTLCRPDIRGGTQRLARRRGRHSGRPAFGYFLEQATRPQTIGYALLDSPVALAAWMLDHDTDSYYKISRAFLDEQPTGGLHPGPRPRQHHAATG